MANSCQIGPFRGRLEPFQGLLGADRGHGGRAEIVPKGRRGLFGLIGAFGARPSPPNAKPAVLDFPLLNSLYCVNGRGRFGGQTAGGHPSLCSAGIERTRKCLQGYHFVRCCHSTHSLLFMGFFAGRRGGQQQFATQALRVHLLGLEIHNLLNTHEVLSDGMLEEASFRSFTSGSGSSSGQSALLGPDHLKPPLPESWPCAGTP